ncbi:Lon protease [Geodia barretti]|uniref:endopeptidase La n=1 Tax=Geodia barretti TaxID=519541 RepID=A0AA35WAU0_GEOBA|nr:Lon protease [Geodia barretti]
MTTSRRPPERLHQVGTAAKVVRKINLPDGGLNVFISTITRFRIAKIMDPGPPLVAATQHLDDRNLDSDEVHALARALISEMKQVSEGNPLFSEEMRLNMVNIDQPGKIADFLASILNIERQQQQHILEQLDVRERMEQVLVFIKKEQELLKIQKRIQGELAEKISKSQRQYFLKEQLKAIKAELGMAVAERVSDELEKFALMDPSSAEFVVTRNYLETIATLPWADPEPDRIDLKRAAAALDADHYGLDDVKERTLEYLAVRKLNPSSRGSILGLRLGREFFRFSVGGMRDEAEIKGHRRTYVGAMPGKIIQGLRIVKTRNPVFMIDEIDKLGMSFQGDPSSALLEVLDPEQNAAFRDHYLDLPFNISEVLFIATANTLDTIPAPLLDRMEMIHLSGYIDTEKLEIARRFIIPKSIARAGLPRGSVRYRRNALLTIADGYARDAGVRNFEKALDKIHRKIARTVVETAPDPGDGAGAPFVIDRDQVGDYLGKPIFRDHDRRRTMRPGTATGLAWTPLGGAVLTVEALGTKGRGGFKLTGQLGDVMQESASIAYSWTRQAARRSA